MSGPVFSKRGIHPFAVFLLKCRLRIPANVIGDSIDRDRCLESALRVA
jgi:hypothetical protein